jgi:hypothetical protein
MDTATISEKEMLKTILKSGKFVGVTFIKKDGTVRKLTGRAGVGKFTNGVGMSFNPEDKGLVVFWESTKSNRKNESDKGYRMIPLKRIIEVRANGNRFVL